MKKIITWTILSLVALSLTGCSSTKKETFVTTPLTTGEMVQTGNPASQETAVQQPESTTYTYVNKEKWFTLQAPDAWTFQENVFNSLVMFYAPQNDGNKAKENLGILSEELTGDIDLSGYYELTRGNVESVIADYKFISTENIKIQDMDAIKLTYQGTQNQMDLEREQVMLIKGETAYVFTYTATQDSFAKHLEDADSIIDSFTLP